MIMLQYTTLILACVATILSIIASSSKIKEKSLLKKDSYKDYRDPITGLLKAKRINKQ